MKKKDLWMAQIANVRYSQTKMADIYRKVKKNVIEKGFVEEIDWQNDVSFSQITESDFLREAGWVILSSGMRETIIRRKFLGISTAFFEWESAEKIVQNKERCLNAAMQHFGHFKKISAIIQIAKHVFGNGFDIVCKAIQAQGIQYIMKLPYMGPATSYHFAKNIGLHVAKPDRHLRRIAEVLGYYSPQLMCADIATMTGDKIPVIDLVFWRFATLDRNYLSYFLNSI